MELALIQWLQVCTAGIVARREDQEGLLSSCYLFFVVCCAIECVVGSVSCHSSVTFLKWPIQQGI